MLALQKISTIISQSFNGNGPPVYGKTYAQFSYAMLTLHLDSAHRLITYRAWTSSLIHETNVLLENINADIGYDAPQVLFIKLHLRNLFEP